MRSILHRTAASLLFLTTLSVASADAQLGAGAPKSAQPPRESRPAAPPPPAVRAAPAPRLGGGGQTAPRIVGPPAMQRRGLGGPPAARGQFRQGPPALDRRAVPPGAFAGRPALQAGRIAGGRPRPGDATLGLGVHRPELRYRHQGRWHRRSFGWSGPVFWPYAYGAVLGYTFWPYDVDDDPFWAYGPVDIYDGLFWPGPDVVARPPARRSTPPARPRVAECGQDIGDVALPIDRIEAAVRTDPAQRAALDELGSATVKATALVRAACPGEPMLTPTGRLDAMERRLDAMHGAVALVREPLDRFYAMLGDEQKARFNALGGETAGPSRTPAGSAGLCREADPGLTAWPSAAIERTIRPTDAQRPGLDALKEATAKAADTVKAACPSEAPVTPPARLAAAGQRLAAMLEAVRSVRAALTTFYGSLDDEQKARFNRIGRPPQG